MAAPSSAPRLIDIIEAIENIRGETVGLSVDGFEGKRWLVERGVEIISEASRRPPDEPKARHPEFRGGGRPASATCCATNPRA
jgi:hypothetical protein